MQLLVLMLSQGLHIQDYTVTQLINDKDLNFLLYDVFKLEALTELERYQDHDKNTFDSILETAKGIATDYFAPHNAKADHQEPSFDGKQVKTIEEVKIAWQQFADAGLLCAQHDYADGGMQLPTLVNMACNAYFMSANPSTVAYSFLTAAAANLIPAFASPEQNKCSCRIC